MPFIKLVDTHQCPKPDYRDDQSHLVIGDIWECDDCKKRYRWQTDQREGNFWMPITN